MSNVPAHIQLFLPVLLGDKRKDRVKISHADDFDILGLAVIGEHLGQINPAAVFFDNRRIAKLLQKYSGKINVKIYLRIF